MTLDHLFSYVYNYIDLAWLPVAWFVVPRQHRWPAVAFILTCAVTLRAQVEIMHSTSHPAGFTPYFDMGAYERGLIVYGIINALFLTLSHFSPGTQRIVYFSACLSVYILALCISMMVMAI